MALSVNYTVREAFTNLRRNVAMTVATIITVAVSLALVGGAFLLKQGVDNATGRWRGGVEMSIFMKADASPSQSKAIELELSQMPEVKRFTFVDHDAAYKEFSEMFADSPEMVESVKPADLPTSYRVVPVKPEFVEIVADRFEAREGVHDVVYPAKHVKRLLDASRLLQIVVLVAAAFLLVSAALLIFNTIRMAIFARRREVAVMKLVGATNWFIRLPFMMEGLFAGLVGSAIAFGLMFVVRVLIRHFVEHYDIGVFNQVIVTVNEVVSTGIVLVAVGAVVGTLGSLLAVHRFLDV
ncbi:MAG TPA: permease-like cell division protein FtsX [Acidimicrobiales bacterium]|nr:permease-like cell division protein FtsX [Acidimicrobiales bacterium]